MLSVLDTEAELGMEWDGELELVLDLEWDLVMDLVLYFDLVLDLECERRDGTAPLLNPPAGIEVTPAADEVNGPDGGAPKDIVGVLELERDCPDPRIVAVRVWVAVPVSD